MGKIGQLNIFQYGDVIIVQEWDGHHCTSRTVKGILTDRYDTIKPKLHGQRVDLEFYIRTIAEKAFRLKTGDYIMMVYKNFVHFKPVSSVEQALKYAHYPTVQHMILNSFYKDFTRSESNARHLHFMGFDFELVRSNGKSFTHGEVYEIFNRIGFPPTFVKKTKSGLYHVILCHTKVTGHKQSIELHKNIQRAIAAAIGYKEMAVGAMHPFSILDRDIRYFGMNVIEFEEMKNWYKGKEKTSYEKPKNENDNEVSIVSFTEHRIWNCEAIKTLTNCEFSTDHSREKVAFTLALLYKAMRKEETEALAFLMEWRKTATKMKKEPLTVGEIRKAVNSGYKDRYWGPKRSYIEEYSGKPFPFNLYHRYRYQRKTDNKSPEENRNAILDFFRNSGGVVEDMTKKELIETICGDTYAYSTIERHLDGMKKKKVIQWEAKRGRFGAKPITFTLLEDELSKQRKMVKETVIEFEGKNYIFSDDLYAN